MRFAPFAWPKCQPLEKAGVSIELQLQRRGVFHDVFTRDVDTGKRLSMARLSRVSALQKTPDQAGFGRRVVTAH